MPTPPDGFCKLKVTLLPKQGALLVASVFPGAGVSEQGGGQAIPELKVAPAVIVPAAAL